MIERTNSAMEQSGTLSIQAGWYLVLTRSSFRERAGGPSRTEVHAACPFV